MLEKLVTAIEPFAFTIIILSGAELAHWVTFTNSSIIGISAVFAGSLLTINHIVKQVIKKPITKE